ncbi:MAG: hypothetical protein NTW65_03980 [Deltaproteobacteria bacterium]|nr:hypothetical protein [Deltaproteobacteria bacterium]
MKTNFIVNIWHKVLVILIVVFVLLSFRNAPAQESIQKQPPVTGKYLALSLGEDKSGFHIILIINTETGKVEKRIFYDELNDHQDVFNFITKEVTTITRKGEKIN